jgi:serine/threonine-protein kinase RsbW
MFFAQTVFFSGIHIAHGAPRRLRVPLDAHMNTAAVDSGPGAGDLCFSVENTPEGYLEGTRRVSERLTDWAIGERPRYIAELALEEMLTNIMRCAYTDSAVHRIDISIALRGGAITLVLEDEGRAFDPTQHRPAASRGPVEDVSIGGRGIMMVQKLVHAMRYERRHGRNHLELVIRNESSPD